MACRGETDKQFNNFRVMHTTINSPQHTHHAMTNSREVLTYKEVHGGKLCIVTEKKKSVDEGL